MDETTDGKNITRLLAMTLLYQNYTFCEVDEAYTGILRHEIVEEAKSYGFFLNKLTVDGEKAFIVEFKVTKMVLEEYVGDVGDVIFKTLFRTLKRDLVNDPELENYCSLNERIYLKISEEEDEGVVVFKFKVRVH